MLTRKRPALADRPSPNGTNRTADSTAYRPEDGYTAPDAEARADLAVLQAAAERGYRLATWCTVCGRALTARKSLLAHVGPVCRAKVVAR